MKHLYEELALCRGTRTGRLAGVGPNTSTCRKGACVTLCTDADLRRQDVGPERAIELEVIIHRETS